MIEEHERIVLTRALPDEGLEPGDVGTVVHAYADGKAYEVNSSRSTATPAPW
jgi:hypothetical protein